MFIPQDLLRNAIYSLSANHEAFIYLKEKFIKCYSLISITGYILGIGDRHLENTLYNFVNGELVSIDFGISFGYGLNIPVPELMPFR